MTTIQKPEARTEPETLADICEEYGVAKLVKTAIPDDYVVYYREGGPGPGMSKYIQLEGKISAMVGRQIRLIADGAPCISWPRYQEAVKDGDVLYQV